MNEYQEYLMEMNKKYDIEMAVANVKYGQEEKEDEENRDER